MSTTQDAIVEVGTIVECSIDSFAHGEMFGFARVLEPANDSNVYRIERLGEMAALFGRIGYLKADDAVNVCEGHESLNGADMGVTVFCNGTCCLR